MPRGTGRLDIRFWDAYAREAGWYVPVCCDGGVSTEPISDATAAQNGAQVLMRDQVAEAATA